MLYTMLTVNKSNDAQLVQDLCRVDDVEVKKSYDTCLIQDLCCEIC